LFNHEPANYDCPFCRVVAGEDDVDPWTKQSDVVARTHGATAWVAPGWWPNNEGHVLVVPNGHIENIYDLTPEFAGPVYELARRVAVALIESYGCDGTSTRQHNGPGGDQEVWHYHLHVFPRYKGDGLYGARRRNTTPDERRPYVERLRPLLEDS
jgi:histidine triad (HIT) family protein